MATFPPSTASARPVRPQAVLARDWLRTLWPASYKGVPFKVEYDEEEGSRRIVEHEFPMRDDPFLEDLGEGVRRYRVDAYVASDSADADAASVIAICAQRGAGALVLPAHGPLIVRCLTFKRNRTKDKHGYIALELRFSREGASSALASIASLANLIFVQADSLALTAALSFASSLSIAGMPGYAADAAVGGVQDNASALEVVRSTATVSSDVSLAQKTEIQSIFDAASTVGDRPALGAGVYTTAAGLSANSPAVDLAARITASARAIAAGMPVAEAATTFEGIFVGAQVVVPAPMYVTPGTLAQVQNETTANRALRMAAIIAYCEAIARITLTDRPTALTLRANVAEQFESELLALSASDTALAHALIQMRDAVVNYLSRSILDLAPVVTVEASLVMPSLFWAWRLYQDPARSREIVGRNRVPHPSFIPGTFEALAR